LPWTCIVVSIDELVVLLPELIVLASMQNFQSQRLASTMVTVIVATGVIVAVSLASPGE
jgi:hypothetical protein